MLIEVKNISHIYSKGLPYETKALNKINFTASEGDFVAIIGCTGSGKTTFVEHLCGLLKPTEGQVLADSIDINEKTPISRKKRHNIGIVFQYPEYQLFEETVLKDVMFGPKNMGLSDHECRARSIEALRLVGLDPDKVGESSPFALSGGQKRRVAIAGVLAMDPRVLILDEPTAGLDPKGHNDIFNMILRIKKEKNLTIFLVSHDMDDVAELANKVIVLKKGELFMTGSPSEVFSNKEMILSAGLSLPSGALFIEKLRARGLDIDSNVLTVSDTADSIIKYLKAR